MSAPSYAHGGNWGAAFVGGAVLGGVIAANSYYRPYYYGPYAYTTYYQQPVYVSPPVYVQQPQVMVMQSAPAPSVRPIAYYCAAANAYYPAVQNCPSGWVAQ